MLLITQNHACPSSVNILDDGGNFRMFLPQSLNKIILRRKHRRCCNQHYHNFPCGKTLADYNMSEKPKARILIIGPNFKRFEHSAYSTDDFIRLLVLYKALLHRNYMVCIFFIYSGNDISFFISVKYSMNRCMRRLVHIWMRMRECGWRRLRERFDDGRMRGKGSDRLK